MEYDNTNRGAIFKNKKKEKDTHPDFTGTLNVNGVEFWVSAWKRKEGASENSPALSFSIKPKEEKADSFKKEVKEQFTNKSSGDGFDDDIPF